MELVQPFSLPASVPGRKHGPGGYEDFQSYKDWLRDEFAFRCVYCLEREMWYPSRDAAFAVEHLLPKSRRPDLICDYDNLAYACLRCNSLKGEAEALDPTRIALSEHLAFESDGSILARTGEGQAFIQLFRLDIAPATEVRAYALKLLHLKADYPDNEKVNALYRAAFGYPDPLPDLRPSAKRPKRNSRPDGVKSCHFVRKLEGKLPDVY